MPRQRRQDEQQQIEDALRAVGQTRVLEIERGIRHRVAPVFGLLFGTAPVLVVADENTFAAAGKDVWDGLQRAGCECSNPFIFDEPDLVADFRHVTTLQQRLAAQAEVIPVAVGSGTINDLTKLAAHQVGRPYMVVATAASMDGYAAYGASITRNGFKRSISCSAPVGILGDLDVLESAPAAMNAAGYADLLAKSVAGADWIVADVLGVESIDATAWEMLHSRLRTWIEDPSGVRQGNSQAVYRLMLGLTISGLAMQWTQTSRPASGAEHQFSHLWDMQQLTYRGASPAHGFKVGIGTLASSALYEQLLEEPLEQLDIAAALDRWPDEAEVENVLQRSFASPVLVERAREEMACKYVNLRELGAQLQRLQVIWPQLRRRLSDQLLSFDQLREYLADAGCPTTSVGIGVSTARLRQSYVDAYYIRRRFTVLDLATRTGRLEKILGRIFGPGGRFGAQR